MGTSRTVAEFTGKIAAAGKAIEKSGPEIITDAALEAKKITLGEIRDVVPDLRMSGVRNARVNVRYDVKGTVNPTALIKATGPLHLVEHDTSAHRIPKAGGRRRRKVKTLRLPSGLYRRSVTHPGTKGQRPFAKGRDKAERKVVALMGNRTTRVVREVFR